ncbi:MAG: DUF371 domain-containing protein [Candidatus Odinarchaeota archaeon]|nr:DUF371 domain-containing protein [Candidatus Thorarchaeota archaeon]
MYYVPFKAFGHENVIGRHKTTVEITSENFLTHQGTCIVGTRATQTLAGLDSVIKKLVTLESTKIVLEMEVNGIIERVTGSGGPCLTYSDSVSMVARTSSYQCGRTLMIHADKAASDLREDFVNNLKDNRAVMNCALYFINQ